MRRHRSALPGGACRIVATYLAAAAVTFAVTAPGLATADTPPDTLTGVGSDVLTPVMLQLLKADGAGLAPDFGSFTNSGLETAVSDFVGGAANSFSSDFLVSERPLTATEASTAQSNGRTFAYVPFAAVPVALVTLVPQTEIGNTNSVGTYCQHMPLSVDVLADLFGFNASQPLAGWQDSRVPCSIGGPPTTFNVPVSTWANEDQTMENQAMMSLLDSTSSSQSVFEAGLLNNTASLTHDTTPSEYWPYASPTIPGGDSALLGKMLQLNPRTLQPSTGLTLVAAGGIVPVSNVWTLDPEGVHWNLPTAAVQNAAGQYVAPSSATAAAAEADASLASTSDPTTNNLVTFAASTTDQTAYNNYLMLEDYLVVPTSGLAADKAAALAQLIRFVLGGKGQPTITSLGAAGATPAMVTAGLKVAQALDVEAQKAHALAASTTTTTTTVASGTGAASSSTTTTLAPGSSGATLTGLPGAGSAGLAATGTDLVPLLIVGGLLLVLGEMARRLQRKRRVPAPAGDYPHRVLSRSQAKSGPK